MSKTQTIEQMREPTPSLNPFDILESMESGKEIPKEKQIERVKQNVPGFEQVEEPKAQIQSIPKDESKAQSIDSELKNIIPSELLGKDNPVEPVESIEPVKEEELPLPPANLNQKQHAAFSEMRRRLDSEHKQSAELKNQIEELKKVQSVKQDAIPSIQSEKQVQELQLKVQDLSDRLEKASIEQHPRFQEIFVGQRNELVTEARRLVEEAGGSPADVDKALALKGREQLEALTEALGDYAHLYGSRLTDVIGKVNHLDHGKVEALKNWQATGEQLSRLDQDKKVKLAQEHRNNLSNALNETLDEIKNDFIVLKKINGSGGDKEWNSQADSIVEEARTMLLEVTGEKNYARIALQAASAPALQALNFKLITKINELEDRLSKNSKGMPSLSNDRQIPIESEPKRSSAFDLLEKSMKF